MKTKKKAPKKKTWKKPVLRGPVDFEEPAGDIIKRLAREKEELEKTLAGVHGALSEAVSKAATLEAALQTERLNHRVTHMHLYRLKVAAKSTIDGLHGYDFVVLRDALENTK